MPKKTRLQAATLKEADEQISGLLASEYRKGDKAEVTLSDGAKLVYVFNEQWEVAAVQ
jgi:hypothetical protein